jgi:hypothetical protein
MLPAVASLPIVPSAGRPPTERLPAPEQVPQLYRSALDLVHELEQRGARREAERLRRDAIAAYSAGWDEGGCRRLERIVETLQRRLASQPGRRRLRIG